MTFFNILSVIMVFRKKRQRSKTLQNGGANGEMIKLKSKRRLNSLAFFFTFFQEPPAFEVDRVLCPICSDVAPNSEPHRIHYGARCCLGCRAFFRRIHQKETVPDYKCKSSNTIFKCMYFFVISTLSHGINPI